MKRKSLLLISLFTLSIILLTGCKCPSCERQEEAVIPAAVLKKADQVIINRTGEEFFNKYIKPDFIKTKYNAPYFDVVYHFYMPEKPYVNAFINFSVDSMGVVASDREINGIPECKDDNCTFNINEEQALKIAKDNGLEPGIKEWHKGFLWDSKLNQYVWHVLSTFQEGGQRSNGKEVIIDPNTGLVLAMNEWHIR